jgi:colanic acid biosynthesis glycosyl transferase WcaI
MSDRALSILLLGINYAPEQSGIAPYTTGLARGLQARGHRVTVVTTHPHYPQWRVDPPHGGWVVRAEVDGVGVTRVRHYVPARPTGLRRALSEVSFGSRLMTGRWGSPDVIVCVSPALISTALALARATSGRHRPATGVVVQDLYSAGVSETTAGGGAVERALTAIERWSLGRADGISVIHDRFKARVVRTLDVEPDRIAVVRNWTHVAPSAPFDREKVRAELGWVGARVVLHAGAMGEKQALGNVVEAAREADRRESDLLFVLLGDGGQRRALEEQAVGVSRIKFLDPLPGELYGQAMRSADLLLVNEKPGVVEMAVPSKLTSYFSTGVPVLAATDATSTTAEELTASGAGVRVEPGDPVALVDRAEALCADHTAAVEIGSRGPVYCARVLSEDAAIDGYEAWIQALVDRARHRRGER